MKLETALRWSWMNVLNKKRYDALCAEYGDLDTALQSFSMEMLSSLGCREDYAMTVINRAEEFNTDQYARELEKRNLRLLTLEDDEYPDRLDEVVDRPIFLYVRGDISILQQPSIAIVGSREMTEYGVRVISHIVPPLVHAGVITVSGLAYGIDAEVAKETVRAGGCTVAVLGHGLGMIYPKANQKLADEIVQKGGVVLSEFPLDTEPDRFTFPARNRIIAGLSLATVVAQATKDSGSLITAQLALEYGRDVCAIPGDFFVPQSEGCHHLITQGLAKLVTSGEEILAEVGIASAGKTSTSTKVFSGATPEEDAIYSALSVLPILLDDLVNKTSFDAPMVNATLTMLELQGVVKNVGGGRWVRC